MARKAKGKRPVYLSTADQDKLLAIVLALTGEVSVLRERLDTLEQLMQSKGMLSIDAIEAYQPSEQVAAAREQWRMEYLDRVLRILHEEVEALKEP